MLDNFLSFSACAHATCEPSSNVYPYTYWLAITIEQTLHLSTSHSRLYFTTILFARVFFFPTLFSEFSVPALACTFLSQHSQRCHQRSLSFSASSLSFLPLSAYLRNPLAAYRSYLTATLCHHRQGGAGTTYPAQHFVRIFQSFHPPFSPSP